MPNWKGFKHSLYSRKKMSNTRKGKPLSRKNCIGISKALRKYWSKSNPNYEARVAKRKKACRLGNTGKFKRTRKHYLSRVKMWRRSSYRKRIGRARSAQMKERNADHDFTAYRLSCCIKVSKPQMSLFRRLCRLGYGGCRLEFKILTFSIDIAFPNKKLAIEVDGKYWHMDKKNHDRNRDRKLKNIGWEVVRISDKKAKLKNYIPEKLLQK